MNNHEKLYISKLIKELDNAVQRGDTEKTDELADILYRLQGGSEADAVMPAPFPGTVAAGHTGSSGRRRVKTGGFKKIIGIVAAAALVMTLGITAFATQLFGLRDMVIQNTHPGVAASDNTGSLATDGGNADTTPSYALLPMQGFPDSKEFKASVEWNVFLENYDTDHAVLNQVGNNPNDFTEKYPMYLVYSKEMADKIEEITAKYGLTLHTSITIAESGEQLLSLAGVGNFLENTNNGGVNRIYSGYVYNDGTFAYDGQAILENGADIEYQFANYVKGTFSEPCLNIGDADAYREWQYTTRTGVQVSLALSETKALIITDREGSFVIVNVLAGTGEDSGFGSSSITDADLQHFADLFDFTQI